MTLSEYCASLDIRFSRRNACILGFIGVGISDGALVNVRWLLGSGWVVVVICDC